MKNDVEFKYAGGGFEVNYNPYTTSYDHPLRQEIRINCFSSGCKTFIKTPDILSEMQKLGFTLEEK